MQPAEPGNALGRGLQHQVIGVGQHHLGARLAHRLGGHGLDRGGGADGHEGGGSNAAVGGIEMPQAGRAVASPYLESDAAHEFRSKRQQSP